MKFTGLILICATSCLALILPAIGVVQFPKTSESRYAASSLASSQGLPVSTHSGIASSPTTLPWTQAMPPSTQEAMPPSNHQASPFQASTMPLGDTANSGTKLGMGVWLMLVPVCLLGLAMWTFAINPTGAKSRSA